MFSEEIETRQDYHYCTYTYTTTTMYLMPFLTVILLLVENLIV